MELSRDMNTVGGTGTSGNCSAASAKVANEPAICVSGARVTLNAWNRRFTVDLSGARPRHWKSEFLSIIADGSPLVFVGVLGLAAWLVWLVVTGLRLIRGQG